MVGVYIDGIKDKDGKMSVRGAVPKRLSDVGAPLYVWDRDKFAAWVEAAAKKAGK